MKAFFTILSLFLSLTVFAQTDTEFWFAVPYVSHTHAFDNGHSKRMQFFSFDEPATIHITQPANPSFQEIVIPLTANSDYLLDLASLLPQVESADGLTTANNAAIRNSGLLIQSTKKIGAYYTSVGNNSETYSLKGRNALGKSFLMPTQFDWSCGYSGGHNTIEILATADTTDVTIKPSKACVGHPANTTFTIRLHKGQTFCLAATGTGKDDHLYNTTINSTKPIAVNYTDDGVNGPGGDLIGDQLVPINLLGTEYIAISNNSGTNPDVLYVFPTEDNTKIYKNGVATPIATLNKGGKVAIPVITTGSIPYAHITSDKPISVLQYSCNNDEPGAAVLPAVSCTGSREVAYKPTGAGNVQLTIVTKTENVPFMHYAPIGLEFAPPTFYPLPDNASWSFAQLKKSFGTNEIVKISNARGVFHAGFFDQPGTTCSFSYFSDFNVFPLSATFDKSFYFEGDDIVLQVPDSIQFTNVSWTGPSEFLATGAQTVISSASLQNSGMYIVNASHVDGCTVEPDTSYITVFEKHLKQEYDICYSNTLTLSAQGSAPYQWSTGASTQNISVQPVTDFTYTVKNMYEGENSQMFQIQDTFFVAVKDSLRPEIAGDVIICNGSATLTTAVTYDTYLWNTGATTQSINVSAPGNYWVKVTSGDCRGTGYVSVAPAPDIAINIDRNPNICQDEAVLEIPFTETAGEVGSFSLILNDTNFPDILNQPISNKVLEIPLNNAKAGIYQAELQVFEKNCGTMAVYPLEITLKYPSDIITQRWNDVLGIKNENFNGGYKLTAFQWYKNGQPISGATGSNFYENSGFSSGDSYNVLLTDISGKQVFTCDFVPEYLTTDAVQTMVKSLQPINLSSSGTAVLYDIAGSVYSVQQTADNKIIAPGRPGVYIMKINNNITKIIVR